MRYTFCGPTGTSRSRAALNRSNALRGDAPGARCWYYEACTLLGIRCVLRLDLPGVRARQVHPRPVPKLSCCSSPAAAPAATAARGDDRCMRRILPFSGHFSALLRESGSHEPNKQIDRLQHARGFSYSTEETMHPTQYTRHGPNRSRLGSLAISCSVACVTQCYRLGAIFNCGATPSISLTVHIRKQKMARTERLSRCRSSLCNQPLQMKRDHLHAMLGVKGL